MSLSKLLPTLDNAGRRLVLAEIVGEPVSVKLARRRHEQGQVNRPKNAVVAKVKVEDKSRNIAEHVNHVEQVEQVDHIKKTEHVEQAEDCVFEQLVQELNEGEE